MPGRQVENRLPLKERAVGAANKKQGVKKDEQVNCRKKRGFPSPRKAWEEV